MPDIPVAIEVMAGAVPVPVPIPVAQHDWWIGLWVTREKDAQGRALTAYTTLKRDFTYRTILDYDQGQDIIHWGTYKIKFPPQDIINIVISNQQSQETQQINQKVQQKFPGRYMAGAVPVGSSQCARGNLTYNIEDWTPQVAGLDFPSPQSYNFQAIEAGVVLVSGPGTNGEEISMKFTEI